MPSTVATKPLGKNGPLVPRLGLGLMVLSGMYSTPGSDAERLKFLDDVYARGSGTLVPLPPPQFRLCPTNLAPADEYKDSEDLIGKWFAANPSKRKDIFLATKFAIRQDPDGGHQGLSVDSSPEYCKQAIKKSLSRLQLPYVDLYYVHRVDKKTPIENTMKVMVELKNEGKIKYIGLSECSADTIRRAHVVHPVTAMQIEYSPFCLAIEDPKIEVLKTCRELGIATVAYSPLGNGLLTGTLRAQADWTKPGDLRGALPWLQADVFEHNLGVVDRIGELAKKKGVSPSQLALAWVLKQGDDVFAIPGTTKIHRLDENLASLDVELSEDDEKAVRQLAKEIKGGRIQDLTGYAFASTPPLENGSA
ncbi:uncharacterized protein LTR77_008767 [Saxophila tyrrhenica]|uniref:NADP-dependent oxidoreductase domain-containing protein n=1 Tax=Saxophila tyrrhenica TaxID=1690608 RepID=A0AAV9P427_9PEZI|nr:hypothetical protein LTR77_008767 [Saxophila tyrrhenica]